MLGRRALTRPELRERLGRRGVSEAEIAAVIARLEAAGFLPPDVDVVRGWARSRVEIQRIGRHRLLGDLLRRGLPEAAADDLITEVLPREREREILAETLERMTRRMEESAARASVDDARGVARLVGRLRRRGFPDELIRSALAERGLA